MIPLLPLGISLVSALAPEIVKMFTKSERAERIAETVVDVVSAATGTQIDTRADADHALKALEADPALLAQVQQQMLAIAAAEHEAVMKDRVSARERDVAVRGLAPNWRANIMLIAVTTGLVVCVGLAFVYPDAPSDARNIVLVVVGALLKMMGDAFAFEFGSSRGSADKSKTIESMVTEQRDASALAAWRASR